MGGPPEVLVQEIGESFGIAVREGRRPRLGSRKDLLIDRHVRQRATPTPSLRSHSGKPTSGRSLAGMNTSRTEQATATSLATIGAFQLALAVGAPWGRAAYGGTRQGTLPSHLRGISGVAAVGYGAGAVLIVRGAGSAPARARAFTTLSVFMTIGAIANGASRSLVERAIWTPVTAATAVLAWRSRSHA